MYKKVYRPSHPRSDYSGHVNYYVLVVEEKLGRSLKSGEIVHHLDFDKTNDDPDNLMLVEHKDHVAVPRMMAAFIKKQGMMEEFKKFFWENKDKKDPEQKRRASLHKLQYEAGIIQRKLEKCRKTTK